MNKLIYRIGLALVALVLVVFPVTAGIVVFYNPASPGVSNQVERIERSVDPASYASATNTLVIAEPMQTPWIEVLTNEPSALKFDGTNAIVLLTPEEKTAITNAVAAAEAAALAERVAYLERLAKTNALQAVDGKFDVDGRILAAFAEIVMDEVNILRSQVNLARTSTTQFQSTTNKNAVALGARTLSQLKTAIRNKIEAQAENN